MQSSNVEAVMNDLKREIETMAQLKHENVVNLLGVTAGERLGALRRAVEPRGILWLHIVVKLLGASGDSLVA